MEKRFLFFVVGDKAISATGVQTVLQKDNPTAEVYSQKGELDPWIEAANMLIKYDAVRFKLYTACTPPLLKLLNIHSFVETQQTPSGRLKLRWVYLQRPFGGSLKDYN